MKLTDFYLFEPLNMLKTSMGIPRDVYGSLQVDVAEARLTELELERLTSPDGLEIEFDQLTVLNDGTLAYKNSRVLLDIRDQSPYSGKSFEPKYHLSNCSTLVGMRRKGKFDKYVVSTHTDGRFLLNVIKGGTVKSDYYNLLVCQNCLDHISFNGFSSSDPYPKKKLFVSQFQLTHFFSKYPRSLHSHTPKYNADNAPLNEYTADWSSVSLRVKNESDWKCQDCGIVLFNSTHRQYLQVHHKNGLKYDNVRSNLLALCIDCHAEQPDHSHIKALPAYKSFLKTKRFIG